SPFLALSFAGLAFLAHELLHGAIVRDRRVRRVLGGLCFAPFAISQRLWTAWHNREHHLHTNQPGRDPDAYPTLEEYNENRSARLMVELGAPGLGRLRGLVTLFTGLSVQNFQVLVTARR